MLDEITAFQLQTSDCVAKGENVGETRIFFYSFETVMNLYIRWDYMHILTLRYLA